MSDAQQVAARLRDPDEIAESLTLLAVLFGPDAPPAELADWQKALTAKLAAEAAALIEAQAAEIARWKALALKAGEALGPFAKAGELFKPRDPDSWDMAIYTPAAGREYDLVGDHLRTAAAVAADIRSASHE